MQHFFLGAASLIFTFGCSESVTTVKCRELIQEKLADLFSETGVKL